jgi:hypothetical protein
MVNQVFLAVVAMIVVILATARTSRVMTTDRIGEGFRELVVRAFGEPGDSKITYMLTVCNWCNTFWTGLALNAYVLAGSCWLFELDWRIAVLSLPPLTLATSYAASRLLDQEGI